ncbi:MAG TPA: cobalamin-dependent protein [Solirubrobacterales bacterium]|nr:cobalamin-dependent protein [Solirubrobacterales bacterium]
MTEHSAEAENSKGLANGRRAAQLSRLYLDAVRAADAPGAFRLAAGALAGGMSTPELYQRVIAPAMHEIGELWAKGALTVADEHLATSLTHRVLAALRPPVWVEAGMKPEATSVKGRVMLAAVEGEQHVLGLRMATDVLEDAGFETIYLGADVPIGALLQAVDSLSPDLLALSATMPELALQLDQVASALRRSHPHLGLLVGGQAASPRVRGGTLVEDLEVLPQAVLI